MLGPPDHIRLDNGSEFTAQAVSDRLGRIGQKTLFTTLGLPWENGCNESFIAKLRDDLLNGEIFCSLGKAWTLIERCRKHYNAVRPHSSLGYHPPASETILLPAAILAYTPRQRVRTTANQRRI